MFNHDSKYVECRLCGFWYDVKKGHICTNVKTVEDPNDKLDKIFEELKETNNLLRKLVNKK